MISPDGHWIAYLSDESGRLELYVREFPSMTGQIRVSSDGAFGEIQVTGIGRSSRRRDGRELLCTATDGRTLMTVDVRPGRPLDVGTPRPLFRLPVTVEQLSPAPDLDRFLLSVAREDSGRSSVTLVINWPALLERAK